MKTASEFEEHIIDQAKKLHRRICLPEAQFDSRTLKAACKALSEGWLAPVLVGEAKGIADLANREKLDIDGIEIVEPATSPDFDLFVSEYLELRRHKENPTRDEAVELLSRPPYYAAMLVRHGLVDGLSSGAYFSSADVLKPSFRIVGLKPGSKTVFAMCPLFVEQCALGKDMLLFIADCAVVPQPDSDQLAEITIAAADMVKALSGESPKAALLSFSTYGSASHPDVEKVASAVEKVRSLRPDLDVDGEMQLDTAVVSDIGMRKAPHSSVAGKADLLICPNLDAANMTTKAMQCFAGAKPAATMILGLNGRVNDHTRGASEDEIALSMLLAAVRVP